METFLFCFLRNPFDLFFKAECTPEEAFSIVGDHIIFGSGSPFNHVDLGTFIILFTADGSNFSFNFLFLFALYADVEDFRGGIKRVK